MKCQHCGGPVSSAEAHAYGGRCESCWAEGGMCQAEREAQRRRDAINGAVQTTKSGG